MQMSEAADRGPVGTDIRETAAPSSFEGFFEQERDKLYRALWLVTRNRFEAEELTQEAFVRVLERWDRVSSVEDPQGYLFMTGMNTFRTTYRRTLLAAKRTTKILPADHEITQVEERDEVVRALGLLSARQRAAVVLIDMVGFRSEEAARMLGVRASTVRTLVSRARAALRETIRHD
jgi:RNA polymerase sigma-70 factor, ECF subfamily